MSCLMRFLGVVLLVWFAALPARAAGVERPVTVFAAASLADVLQAVGDAFTAVSGNEVRFSFASSSVLARQIIAGAPADVFISANADWMDELDARRLLARGTRSNIASNRLVMIAPADNDIPADTIDYLSAPDFAALLGEDGRLALGDPDHVPAGVYARQALIAWGVWAELEPRLARADNVRAALALVARGEAPLGIVYASDARISDQVRVIATVPANLHKPITYPMALMGGRVAAAANAFSAYLVSPQARAVFAEYGFTDG